MAVSPQIARMQARMAAIPKAVRLAVIPALVASGEDLAATMRHLAPHKTGALAESIVMTPPNTATPPYSQPGGSSVAGELEVLVTAGNTDVRYAHLVEHGTVAAAEQPFFFPAVRMLAKRNAARINRAMRKAIKDGWIQ